MEKEKREGTEVDDAHNDKNTLEEQSDKGNQDRTHDTFFLFSLSVIPIFHVYSFMFDFFAECLCNASCEKRKDQDKERVETMRMMVLMMTKTMIVMLEALFVNRC